MNSDIAYPVLRSRSGAMYRAAWKAVWGPLLGIEDCRGFTREHAQINFDKIRAQWRHRLMSLREAGWAGLDNRHVLTHMRNCPPFGVLTDSPRMQTCNRLRMCPFCWGREVIKVYSRTSRLLWLPREFGQRRAERRKGTRLLAFRYQRAWPRTKVGSSIEYLSELVRRERNRETDQVCEKGSQSPLGSYVFHVINIYPKHVVFQRRGLIVTKSRKRPAKTKGLLLKRPLIRNFTRDQLAECIASVCRYPAHQMQCSGNIMAWLLAHDKLRKLRMHEFRGAMRNQ